MKYRVTTYLTLAGYRSFIELGDHAYGEWIIYAAAAPKFHVNLFRQPSRSIQLITDLLEKHNWTIEAILEQISRNEGIPLNLGKRPSLAIVRSSELKEFHLPELPADWLERLVNGS